MNVTHTTIGGTAIYEPTQEEFASFLDDLATSQFGMSVSELEGAYKKGELDEASPQVSYLLALLGARTNGD